MPQLHTASLNLQYLFTSVRKALSESTAGFWTDLEVYSKLNNAQQFIARKSKTLQKEVTVTTVSGTQEYDLKDESFSDITDIAEDGVTFLINGSSTAEQPLEYRTKKRLNTEFPGWQGVAASTPQFYYYNKATKTIGLYPKPNSTNAGAYLKIEGYYRPVILHAGTAKAGSATTLTLAVASSTAPAPNPVDDYYNGIFMEIYDGTGEGEKAEITDYDGSDKKCTVNFTTTPDTTTVYGMVPSIPEESMYLMELYALWKLWPKGGSRTLLGRNFKQEFFEGLGLFIGESIEADDELIVKDTYR